MPPTRTASSSASRAGASAAPPPPRTVVTDQGAGDEDEEWDNVGDADVEDARGHKANGRGKTTSTRGKKAPAPSRTKRTNQSSQPAATDDIELLSDEEQVEPSADRVRELEEQLKAMKAANQSLITQFDQLKSLRNTTAETDLKTYKDASETMQRNSKDLISSLRTRLDQTEKKLKAATGSSSSSGDDAEAMHLREENGKLRTDVDRLRKERNEANEIAERLSQELKSTRRQQQTKPTSDRLLDVEKEAIRELYEDLTGITIQKVEELPIESDAGDSDDKVRRRFKAFFNAVGHYDLLCSFEEWPSSLPESDKSGHQDLMFCPHFDPKVDHELLEKGSLPSHFQEQMRFNRANSVKFMGSLTRGLRKK